MTLACKINGVDFEMDPETMLFSGDDLELLKDISKFVMEARLRISGVVPTPHREVFYAVVEHWTATHITDDEPVPTNPEGAII
jgi:hypothetical protein